MAELRKWREIVDEVRQTRQDDKPITLIWNAQVREERLHYHRALGLSLSDAMAQVEIEGQAMKEAARVLGQPYDDATGDVGIPSTPG